MADASAPTPSSGASADAGSFDTRLLRHVREGIILVRAGDGAIVFANPHFERMFGYEPQELIGRSVALLNAANGTDPRRVADDIAAALRRDGRWEGELRNRRKDGTDFWCHASVSAFDHPELGTVWVAIHRDVSERKRLEEELLHTKSFLDSIIENIPDMVFVKDAKELKFVLFNRAGAEFVGRERADLIGKGDHDFFPRPQADFFTAIDRAALRGAGPLEIPEEPIATAGRGVRIIRTKKIPILDEKGDPAYVLGISEDVTERHHAERLRRRHEREMIAVNSILRALETHVDVRAAFPKVCAGLRALAQCTSASLALFDEHRERMRLIAVDAPWAAGVGGDVYLRVAEYPGSAELLAGRSHEARDLAALADLPLVRLSCAIGFRSTLSLPLYTGEDVIGILTLLWDVVDGPAAVDSQVLRQVTGALAIALERRRLYEQVRAGREELAALSRRLLVVQESERRHLARELHDEIGQYLTGISLLLNQLEHRSSADFRTSRDELDRLVTDLIDRVRELSLDLRPAMLDDLGLLPALRSLFRRFSRQTGIAVEIAQVGLERRFSPDVETAVYRIVQEALTNVARHAQVQTVAVGVTVVDDRLRVVVADQGRGFDADAELAAARTSGLSGMRERTTLLGGRFRIEARPGGGTCVRAEFESGAAAAPGG